MATVYHAFDPLVGRDVALKMMRASLMRSDTFRTRFEREVRTIAALEHPSIVPLYDFGEHEGRLYLVMRLMRGGTLTDRIKKGALSPEEALTILQQIVPAIDEAHARGIVHRDLKPANILFDGQGHAFLSDFGIVKLTESLTGITSHNLLMGTPAYMSPEQFQSEAELDGRSDIYALGIVPYRMLCGKAPFEAETPAQLMMMHVTDPVPDIRIRKPELPAGSTPLLARAMAKKPEERFPTVAAFLAAFQNVLQADSRRDETPPVLLINEPTDLSTWDRAHEPTTAISKQIRYWLREDGLVLVPPREKQRMPRESLALPAPKPLPPPPEMPESLAEPSAAYQEASARYELLRAQQLNAYRAELRLVRERLDRLAAEQRRIAHNNDPPLSELDRRLKSLAFWMRRRSDEDYLHARVGTGRVEAGFAVAEPTGGHLDERYQAAQDLAARKLAADYAEIDDLPLLVNLSAMAALYLIGPESHKLANTLLMQLAFHHAPGDLAIYLFSHHPDAGKRWGWLKWLPHTRALVHQGRESRLSLSVMTSSVALARLSQEISQRQRELEPLTPGSKRKASPHLIVLADGAPEVVHGAALTSVRAAGVELSSALVVLEDAPSEHRNLPTIMLGEPAALTLWNMPGHPIGSHQQGAAELATANEVERLARKMTTAQLVGPDLSAVEPPARVSLLDLLGAATPDQLNLWRLYRDGQLNTEIAIPLGRNRYREIVRLTLAGTPPLGGIFLCGVPGSGRRALVRTLILSLAASYAPDQVSVVAIRLGAQTGKWIQLYALPHVRTCAVCADEEQPEHVSAELGIELTKRRRLFASLASRLRRPIPDLATYNRFLPEEALSELIVIVDGYTGGWRESPGRGIIRTFAGQARLEPFQAAETSQSGEVGSGRTSASGAFDMFVVLGDGRRQLLHHHPAGRLSGQDLTDGGLLLRHIVDYCRTAGYGREVADTIIET